MKAGLLGTRDHGSSPRTRGTLRLPERLLGRPRFIPAHAGNARSRDRQGAGPAVHPRARGERAASSTTTRRAGGSSPRTRGTPDRPRVARRSCRFIPAHAGNAFSARTRAPPGSVHPRARGERGRARPGVAGLGGSSPRTRGTRGRGGSRPTPLRFIPAHAGNARCCSDVARRAPVHPRARGERASSSRQPRQKAGSSPRTRGTRSQRDELGSRTRFIPAHAGNATRQPVGRRSPPVHPRARGERMMSPMKEVHSFGSSPRTRGTLEEPRGPHVERRFIPAHAGNAAPSRGAPLGRTVHPRARGERDVASVLAYGTLGSSPRTRGTHGLLPAGSLDLRFIPAHAGNARRSRRASARTPVHPRARGERELSRCVPVSTRGSSPRTRGTPVAELAEGGELRFIPAHAGNAQ